LAIVPVEDGPNWTWFLNHAKAAGTMDKNPVILSDRQKGLINACNTVCPQSPHRFCMQHIVANIRSTKGLWLTQAEEGLAYRMARSDSSDTFELLGQKMSEVNPGALRYLTNENNLQRANWVTYAFSKPTYNNVTSNLGESANKWLGVDLRSSNAVQLHFKYLLHLLVNLNARRENAMTWTPEGITPYQLREYSKTSLAAQSITLLVSKPGREFMALYKNAACAVSRFAISHMWRRVDVVLRTCDCKMWLDHSKPCIHAVACLNSLQQDPLTFYNAYYSRSHYKQIYSAFLTPVAPLDLVRDTWSQAPQALLGSDQSSKPGPKPKKRKKSRGMRS
ncbi:hypothetical protein AaE_016184, partial [Aphanomyces astaci]